MYNVKTQLRTTSDIRDWLAKRASQNDRSMNAEINHILKEKRQQDETQQKAA